MILEYKTLNNWSKTTISFQSKKGLALNSAIVSYCALQNITGCPQDTISVDCGSDLNVIIR